MQNSHTFLVPDYYKHFSCKCSDCRASCCHGWSITLSMDDYYHVINTDCSDELRRKLDIAFRPATNPAPSVHRFAMISHNWIGRCPLEDEQGLCLLHRECGEGALPEVCRRHPRMTRLTPTAECCTSNSCERTLELLFLNHAPLTFECAELTFVDDELDALPAFCEDKEHYLSTRKEIFELISDRSVSLNDRINNIAQLLGASRIQAFDEDNAKRLCVLLSRSSTALSELLESCDEVRDFALESVPYMDIYLEKMLANHIFYKGFPFSYEHSSARAEVASLNAVLALHRYVCERYISKYGYTLESFIDCTAKLFRMIEHSDFDRTVAKFVGEM